jgi:eukaryotic-like serine/threonine-protein kinase
VVIEQNPATGQLEVHEPVDLTVSRGKEPVDVPNVVGLSEGEAGSLLTGADLQVSVTEEFSGTVPEGDVISQSPDGDEVVPVGSTVTIVVSKGPRKFPMPDVVGKSEAEGIAQLEGLDLVVDVVEVPNGPRDKVVGQQPDQGTTVKQGQTVTIYVGGG